MSFLSEYTILFFQHPLDSLHIFPTLFGYHSYCLELLEVIQETVFQLIHSLLVIFCCKVTKKRKHNIK